MLNCIKTLKGRLRLVCKSDLFKVFSLTAISTCIKMITSLVSTKVVAYIVGPSGVAMLGQLSNFVLIIMNVASGGINTAITKYIAEYKESEQKVVAILSTAFMITLCFAIPTSIIIIAMHKYLSEWIMLSPDYGFVFIAFGLTLIFYALNNLLLYTVNGFKLFRIYTLIGISSSVLGLIITILLVAIFKLKGALVASVTFQSVVFLATVLLLRKQLWFKVRNFTQSVDKIFLNKFLKYSTTTIVFMVSTPFIQILLRGYVMADISEIDAGVWEGLNRISTMYLMVFSMSLTVYYVPRLSELQDTLAIRSEIIKAYKFLIPCAIFALLAVYVLRNFIIWLLFTPEFQPMEALFIWQLPLDFIKIISNVISYLLIAKAHIKAYSLLTIFASVMYLSLGFLFLKLTDSVVGIIMGEMITQLLYITILVFYFRKILFKRYITQ